MCRVHREPPSGPGLLTRPEGHTRDIGAGRGLLRFSPVSTVAPWAPPCLTPISVTDPEPKVTAELLPRSLRSPGGERRQLGPAFLSHTDHPSTLSTSTARPAGCCHPPSSPSCGSLVTRSGAGGGENVGLTEWVAAAPGAWLLVARDTLERHVSREAACAPRPTAHGPRLSAQHGSRLMAHGP
uniref:Uncharacterized protein n=1 Tax=Myotis myotis TaxID=51298 RepID=A0A7J7XZV7_MYOMY|nr:hypothetical protein mMyoMyo1_011306 [Myotis myotis]